MQGVIERAEFWAWYEYNREDLRHFTFVEARNWADLYVMVRQDGRTDVREWLRHSKWLIASRQDPLFLLWKRLAQYDQGQDHYEEAA